MSFIKDIPDYKTLNSNCYFMNKAPSSIWNKLEAYACKVTEDSADLKEIVNALNELALIPRTQNWGYDWLAQDLSYVISAIRKTVDDGKFSLLMDAIQAIAQKSNADLDELNELLDDEQVGYHLCCEPLTRKYYWEVKDNIDDLVERIEETKIAIKSQSQQAVEHFEQAKKQLENSSSERARKDAVRDCASAMEAIIKLLGGENDIKNASKKLRGEKIWGKDEIVKDGDAIFNMLHRLYPDLRHGSIEMSQMSFEEALYWTDRITAYINYMMRVKATLNIDGRGD